MRFGAQTVTFIAVTEDLLNRDRYNNPTEVRTEVDVVGCHFRPLTAKEKLELGDVATDPWKCTAPPDAAVLAAAAVDELKHKGVTYKVIGGVRPFNDFSDRVFKCTVICERTVS